MNRFFISLSLSLLLFATSDAQPSYEADVKPIIADACLSCHYKSGIGPIPLSTFKEVKAYADMIVKTTEQRRMPPWRVDESGNTVDHHLALNKTEIETLKLWVKGGMLPGTKGTTTKPVLAKQLEGADVRRFAMKERYHLPVDAHSEYAQVFVLPTGLDTDVYVTAIQFIPGNRRVIRYCNIAVDTGTRGEILDGKNATYGYPNFGAFGFQPYEPLWYQWTPDKTVTTLPAGYLKRLPANCRLLLYISYMSPQDGTQAYDSSSIVIRTTQRGAADKIITSRLMIHPGLLTEDQREISAGDERQLLVNVPLKDAITIHSIMPMGQFICRNWHIAAIDATGKHTQPLLQLGDWDFNWRRNYEFTSPLKLNANAIIRAIASFDNTEKNVLLPILPPTKTGFGEGKKQEMFQVYMEVSE